MAVLYKHLLPLRTVLYVLFSAVFALTVALPGPACAADDIYTVENVEVDVTADNAVQAREKAFDEAQLTAYRMLAEKILSDEELMSFTVPDINTVSAMVQDYEVTSEQLSSVRYKGTYTIRFRSGAIRQYASNEGYQYTDIKSEPILILPFYQYGERTMLWENGNPFMAAWARAPRSEGLVPTIVPIGDLMDVSQVQDDQAFTYDPQQLTAMVRRYHAGEALIMVAMPERMQDRSESVNVSLYSAGSAGPEFQQTFTIAGKPADPQGSVYDQAVIRVRDILKHDWKSKAAVNTAQVSEIEAKAYYATVQEWVRIKSALEKVSGVRSLQVKSLRPKDAEIKLQFSGDVERLKLALGQAGITMNAQSPQFAKSSWRAGGSAPSPDSQIYDIYVSGSNRY